MARPTKSDIDKRVHQVNIRLTKSEHRKATEYAQASGMTPANWIRAKVFSGKFPAAKMSTLDQAVYHELKKIGVNLNQATHRMNTGEMPKEYLVIQLKLQAILQRILKLLIQ